MMTSGQIAQQTQHAFSMGYGANPGLNSYEGYTGITPFGHGAGTQAGAGIMSGFNSGLHMATMGGLASWAGGGLLKRLGLGHTGVARGLGGVARATGMMLPMSATLGMVTPAMLAVQGMATGGQQYAQTQNIMDQAFGNKLMGGGRFGYGVSRQQALSMTEALREIKAVPEMMTTMNELQDVLGSVSKMGILQGARSATEFKDKFTSMVHALRDMSRDLGTTMKEAQGLFAASVGQGFLDVDQAMVNARMTKSATGVGIGMGLDRMVGLQAQGSAMVRGFGGDSRAGAFGARDFASSISIAQQQGTLSGQDILSITGQTGEAGVASLSQMLMGAQVQMFQKTGAGRYMTAALAQRDDKGMFTGGLNQDLLKRLRNNEISGSELMRLGRESLSGLTGEQALSFDNAMARGMGADAGALAGSSGGANAIAAILSDMGGDNDQAKRTLIRRITGMNQRQTDAMMALARDASSNNKMRNQQMLQAAVRDRSVSFFKERMLSGQMHHLTTGAQNLLIDPFHRQGTAFAARAGGVWDDITDEFISGSVGTKVNMLLNPYSWAQSAGRLMFDDPSVEAPTSGQKNLGLQEFLSGGAGREDPTDLTRSAAYGFVSNPGWDFLDGNAKKYAMRYSANNGLWENFDRQADTFAGDRLKKLLGVRAGDIFTTTDFDRVANRSNYRAQDITASKNRVEKMLLEYGNVEGMMPLGQSELQNSLANLAEGDYTALDTLQMATLSGDENIAGQAKTLQNKLKEQLVAGVGTVTTGMSLKDARSTIRTAFQNPGAIDNLFGGTANKGSRFYGFDALQMYDNYLLSDTALSIAMSGDPEKQKVLLRILKDPEVSRKLSLAAHSDDELKKIASEFSPLTFQELKSLAKKVSEAYKEGDEEALMAVAEDIEPAMARINEGTRQQVAKATRSAIKSRLGSSGESVLATIESGGLFKGLGGIVRAIREGKGDKRFQAFQKSLSTSRFSGRKEAEVVKQLESRYGITRSQLEQVEGFSLDDTLTKEEEMAASQLATIQDMLRGEVDQRTSTEFQRAKKLGLTSELQLEIAKTYESALKASEDSLKAHMRYQTSIEKRIAANEERTTQLEVARQ